MKFSKSKFIEIEGKEIYERHNVWVDYCDGKDVTPVEDPYIYGVIPFGSRLSVLFSIFEEWCE